MRDPSEHVQAITDALTGVGMSPANARELALVILRVLAPLGPLPGLQALNKLERDERVYELRGQNLAPQAIATRMGISRSTVYRSEESERQRKKDSAA